MLFALLCLCSGTSFPEDQASSPADLSFCSWSTTKQVCVSLPLLCGWLWPCCRAASNQADYHLLNLIFSTFLFSSFCSPLSLCPPSPPAHCFHPPTHPVCRICWIPALQRKEVCGFWRGALRNWGRDRQDNGLQQGHLVRPDQPAGFLSSR